MSAFVRRSSLNSLVTPSTHSLRNQQLWVIGFTLAGGTLGFYLEDKVEAYYKVRTRALPLHVLNSIAAHPTNHRFARGGY